MNSGSVRDDDPPPAPAEGTESGEAHSSTLRARHDDAFDALLRDIAAVDQTAADLLPKPGETVAGKYRVEEQLGRGGMGAVYRATHLISEKQVAIKWMLRSASDVSSRQRFLREAKVAARIDHPNVVDVYDVGQDRGSCLYMVMQLLKGESLRATIARGRMGVSETIDLLLPAMRGVAAVHQAGVVHRDLKPDNIFICEAKAGKAREAKVLDFGISAMDGRDKNDPTLTRDGTVMGTPGYMSPEQLNDSRQVDLRTDVYAFGVILYEALTGSLPFQAESYNGLLVAVISTDPSSPSTLRPEVPKELSRLVLRALAKDREQRFASMDSLIAALEPFGTLPRTTDPDAPRAGRRPTLARSARVALAAACLLAGLAYWLYADPKPSGSPAARTEAPRTTLAAPTATEPPAFGAAPLPLAPTEAAAPDSAVHGEGATRRLDPPATTLPLKSPTAGRAAAKRPALGTDSAGPAPASGAPESAPDNSKARSGKISLEEL